jgi:drug/metabolite transporter (DMT)-like permease
MKIGLKSFSNTQVAGIRVLLASLVLLPYSIRNLRTLQKKDVKYLLVAGFLGTFIPAFLFTKAQTRIDSALAGMLNSLTPVFTLVVGLVFHKRRTRWQQVVGLVLGLVGALGLIISGKSISLGNMNTYAFFIVAATLCYAISINVVKIHLTHLRGVQISSLAFLFIGPAAVIYLLTTDFKPAFNTGNWVIHLSALAVLGIIGTAIAMLIMYSLIRYTSAVFASSVTYIIPVFAVLWGLMDHETITWLYITFMTLILLGVYLINRKS